MARNSLSDHRQSDPAPHSATPLSARGSHNYEKLVCSSRVMELPNAAEILLTVILEKRQGTESDTTVTYNCPIFDIFGLTFGRRSRTKQRRNTKLGTQSAKGL